MTLSLAAKLKEQIANKNAALSTQRAQLSADAPSVQATRDELAGLQRELAKVEAQVTALPLKANGGEKPLTSVLGAFQQLADDKVFAEKAYQSALTSLETARMDASKQQVYLATIVPPGLPEEAAFPSRRAKSRSRSASRWRFGSSGYWASIRSGSICSLRPTNPLHSRTPCAIGRQGRRRLCNDGSVHYRQCLATIARNPEGNIVPKPARPRCRHRARNRAGDG